MRFRILCLMAIAGFVLPSCDDCKNLDCRFSDHDGRFRIVSSTGNTDLLFGNTRVYDINNTKFYSLKGTDTTFFSQTAEKSFVAGIDSVLRVRFFPKADTAFLKLSNGDVDTLNLSYTTTTTRCCGTITEITSFRYNNKVDLPGSLQVSEIRK